MARQQTAEIVIPLRRLDVEEQRLIADAHFSAKDRLDARTPCRLHEFNRALLNPTRQSFVQLDIEPRNASMIPLTSGRRSEGS